MGSRSNRTFWIYADMEELEDSLPLEGSAVRRLGAHPSIGIKDTSAIFIICYLEPEERVRVLPSPPSLWGGSVKLARCYKCVLFILT